jgi:hypothetical protein
MLQPLLLLLAGLLLEPCQQAQALGPGQMPALALLCLAVRVQRRLLVLPSSAVVLLQVPELQL